MGGDGRMWPWVCWTVLAMAATLAVGWALRGGPPSGADLLRSHDADAASAAELVGNAWNPATVPMRDRAFDPPTDPPGYRT